MQTLRVTYHATALPHGEIEETVDLEVKDDFSREITATFDEVYGISRIYVSGPVWVESSGRSSQMLLHAIRMLAYLKGQGFVSIVSVKTI